MLKTLVQVLCFFAALNSMAATELVYPWVTKNTLFRGKVIVNNLNDAAVEVTLRAVRPDPNDPNGAEETVTLQLGPLAQQVSETSELFPNLLDGSGFAIFLSSSADQIEGAFVVTGTKEDGQGSSPAQGNVVPATEVGTVLLFSYLPSPDDPVASSAPVVVNMGSQSTRVTFYAYQEGMRFQSDSTFEIPAGRPFAALTSAIFPDLEGDLYLVAQADQPLMGMAFLFNEAREPSMANATLIDSVPEPDDASTNELQAGTNQITIDQEIDGATVSRSVYIKAPDSLDHTQKYPIVFAFHGAGGSGSSFLNNEHLNQLIDSGAFIGVYPDGHSNDGGNGGFWNLGTEPTNADDVQFVDFIVQTLATYRELDTTRIYGLGFSNGAGMINLLGKSTAHFRAIAPLYTQQSTSTGELTPPTVLSVFQLNGNVDTLIPVDGGPSPVGEFLSARDSALNWVNFFNCSSSPQEESLTWGGVSLDSFTYANCEANHEIKYFIALGIGHSGFADAEATSTMFSEIWSFFQRH
ncbi:Esterase PHB depolymerase [Sulfidibacter corallicola]|uniref:Polyhydroxybutyrate depolymerase n=1 Tax=Sulfidibacter corallicola TaxID=2818388 RepID=A0A8A4TFW8_SULCO|nr:PHB depolymerase family esterase [Sulfidibacter corallicola]QTD48450.1 hypothetical protein J3U87_22960 [Sulfidibacter corallicola]